MTTLSGPTDVHLRCLSPDFAASAFRLLKANSVHPDVLVGSLIVIPTNGSVEDVERVIASAISTRMVSPESISVTCETPSYLRGARPV